MAPHPDLAVEQGVLNSAYAHAAASSGQPLVFGRIDHGRDRRYVGRHDVVDENRRPLVLAWHSPAAAPFYAAEPATVTLKRQFLEHERQLTTMHDEIVDGDDRTGATARELMERFRGNTMQPATATLTAQQYAAVAADPGAAVIVGGGPGTGKTQAGLHRAAWLAHRRPEIRAAGIAFVAPSAALRSCARDVLSVLDADDVVVTDTVDSSFGHVIVDEADGLSRDDIGALVGGSASFTLLGDLPPEVLPAGVLPDDVPSDAHHVTLTTSFRVPGPVADLLVRQLDGSHRTRVTSLRGGIGRPLVLPTAASMLEADAVRAAAAAAGTGFRVAVVVPGGRLETTRRLAGDQGPRVTVAAATELSGLEFDAVAVVAPDEIVAESDGDALYLALSRCTQSLALFHAAPLPPGLDHLRPPSPGKLPQL